MSRRRPLMPSRAASDRRRPRVGRATGWTDLRIVCWIVGVVTGLTVEVATGQGFAGAAFAPSEAAASMRVAGGGTTDAWVDLALEAIEFTHGPIRPGWESGERLRSRLAPESGESFHAIGPGGRHWLHAVRWNDPIAVEFGLQRLGSRPMGGGRFRLPALGLELVIADDWLLISPNGCPWLDQAIDTATLGGLDELSADLAAVTRDLPPAAVEIVLRHAGPNGGCSAIGIQPTSDTHARVEFGGHYAASPLPIRTVTELDLELTARFDGRVALATMEGGIGLLDPLMVRHAARHPEIVPPADLRSHFASRRLLVLDGEPVNVDPIGVVEVPTACVAIPWRTSDADAHVPPDLVARIDAWLESAGRAVRSTWNDVSNGPSLTRGSEIRHLSMAPGLLEAVDGHPMALGASLNWTVHTTSEGEGWLVAGTTPGLVRRVTATLSERHEPGPVAELAGAGVASPARIALQIAELAQLRALGDDADAGTDADALTGTAHIMNRIERISWRLSRQDERVVRASAEVRLVPGATPTAGLTPR